jgi:hypothetical protein
MWAALVTAMMTDSALEQCVRDSGKSAAAYIREGFDLRSLTLRGGEQMTIAVATDPCMARGQSTRIMIYRAVRDRYDRVLDSVTLPESWQAGEDGTATLPTHESMETIFESTYVWNGKSYVFSPWKSHIYDVALGERRPYQIPIRFAPGALQTTLSGNVALNFGEEYVLSARAGQTISIELSKHGEPAPWVALYYDDRLEPVADRIAGRWSGVLPRTGEYHLLISGTDDRDAARRSSYALVVRLGSLRSVR